MKEIQAGLEEVEECWRLKEVEECAKLQAFYNARAKPGTKLVFKSCSSYDGEVYVEYLYVLHIHILHKVKYSQSLH